MKTVFEATYVSDEFFNEEMIIKKFLKEHPQYSKKPELKITAISEESSILKNWKVAVYEKS